MKTRSIAIIGGGFCGAMVATHLLRLADSPITIKLIDRRTGLGQGVAYSTSWPCHLLNVCAAKMSAFPDDSEHFRRWMGSSADAFVSRSLYGQYVQSILTDAIRSSRMRFEAIADEAVKITTEAGRAKITLASGATCQADRVVLALGNFPPRPLKINNSAFYQSDRYATATEFDRILADRSSDAPLLLIGSGLTAIDQVLTLHQRQHRGQIHLISRRGLLPQAHQPTRPHSIGLSLKRSNWTIRELLREVRQAIASGGADWRSIIDALRPETQQIWQQLSIAEQQRFLRHLRPYWEVHRHRLAPTVADTIAQLQDRGQLIIHTGRIQNFEETEDCVTVHWRSRHQQEVLQVAAVVNCTGPEADYAKVQHPLICDLFDRGLIRSHPLGLGLSVAKDGAVVDATGSASGWLYTLGAAQKGELWETTAVPELRQQAIDLAQTLLHSFDRAVPQWQLRPAYSSRIA